MLQEYWIEILGNVTDHLPIINGWILRYVGKISAEHVEAIVQLFVLFKIQSYIRASFSQPRRTEAVPPEPVRAAGVSGTLLDHESNSIP